MKLETIALHHGYDSAKNDQKSANTPIYQTSGFTIDDTQHGADLFSLKVEGNIYSRIGNPTNDVLEKESQQWKGVLEHCHLPLAWRQSHMLSSVLQDQGIIL